LIAVTLGMFLSLVDATIVNVAIPQLQLIFGADVNSVQWVVTIYMLTQAIVIPTAPYFAKKFGAGRTYVWTLTAFLAGSALCGFAQSLLALVIFRFVQGIGGGILLPLVMTLLYQAFPPQERPIAVSVMGVPLMIAPLLGPVVGGYLVGALGWRWAFFINLPLGALGVVVAANVLWKSSPEARTRFDVAGFLTVAGGSAMLLCAVASARNSDVLLRNVAFLIAGTGLLLAFVLIESVKVRKGNEPLLDLWRLGDKKFLYSTLAQTLFGFVWFGLLFLIPIYLQRVRLRTASESGLILGVQALTTLAVVPIGGKLAHRVGPRLVCILGLTIFAGGVALLRTLDLTTPIPIIVTIMIVLGTGIGLRQQIPVAAMSQIETNEHREIANASTLLIVLHSTAAPMGVATLSSILQLRSQYFSAALAAQGIEGDLLNRQNSISTMHEAFLVALIVALSAFGAMCLVPKDARRTKANPARFAPIFKQ